MLLSRVPCSPGEGDALVYATGQDSFFGRTTALVQSAGTVSHFQRAVMRIAHYLIVLAVALVGLTAAVSLLPGTGPWKRWSSRWWSPSPRFPWPCPRCCR